jgi:sporulation protein YlmC with PRC-barrel domain
MRIKEEVIGKEVVDASAIVIGKVKDVEVELETQTLEAIIIGKGGILESLGISKDETVIPYDNVEKIGDKILLKSEIKEQ